MKPKFLRFFFTVGIGVLILWPLLSFAGPSAEKAIVITSLPDNLKLILGLSETQFYLPRVKAIHALPGNLPPDQIQACYDFLSRKIETQQLTDLEFNGLKNELVFALMKQQQKPAALAGHLVKNYYDRSNDNTWRDYCVQFFGKWYHEAPENQGKKDMAAGLWHALEHERGNRIGGTAGSMLGFLVRRYPEFKREQVCDALFAALSDARCANISKVALLQTCAELGDSRALPAARELSGASEDPVLRASAIAAVGTLGDKSDIAWLKKLESANDIRIRRPAAAAIRKLAEK